ncbi:MAG: NUDIX domain-containing protein [Thermoplasmata archaeon]
MGRWKKIESRKVADSTFFTLEEDDVRLPDGQLKTYTMLEIPDFAGVLPVVDDKMVMIKNYRYPIDEMVLELPAGLIDEEESPIETAERELEEETGYILKDAEKLVEYHPIASLNTQKAHLFIGDAEEGGKINRDKGEEIEIKIIPIKKIYKKLENRELSHPHTMIALFYAKDILFDKLD